MRFVLKSFPPATDGVPDTMMLTLRRITLHAFTRGGRPYVTIPSGLTFRVTLPQLAALARESAFIREHEGAA